MEYRQLLKEMHDNKIINVIVSSYTIIIIVIIIISTLCIIVIECFVSSCLFYFYQNLHTIHVGFHSDLQKAFSNRHNTFTNTTSLTIADCFIKWKEKFLTYGEFCSNLPKVQTLLDKIMQNPSTNQCLMVRFIS